MSFNRDKHRDRLATRAVLLKQQPVDDGMKNWLGHQLRDKDGNKRGTSQIDEMLLDGAARDEMLARIAPARADVDIHLHHLKKEHGLPLIERIDICKFNRVALGATNANKMPRKPQTRLRRLQNDGAASHGHKSARKGSPKDQIFKLWLQNPWPSKDQKQRWARKVQRKVSSINTWVSAFVHDNKNVGYPRHSAIGREKEILAAQKMALRRKYDESDRENKRTTANHQQGRGTSASYKTQKFRKQVLKPRTAKAKHILLKGTDNDRPPPRIRTIMNRVYRDSRLSQGVKQLHGYRCQIKGCKHLLKLPDNTYYAEAHHIRPLGKTHKGHNRFDNILCVCPHHHAALDMAIIKLSRTNLDEHPKHRIADEAIAYHNKLWHEKSKIYDNSSKGDE